MDWKKHSETDWVSIDDGILNFDHMDRSTYKDMKEALKKDRERYGFELERLKFLTRSKLQEINALSDKLYIEGKISQNIYEERRAYIQEEMEAVEENCNWFRKKIGLIEDKLNNLRLWSLFKEYVEERDY
jgi:hypothetical protein